MTTDTCVDHVADLSSLPTVDDPRADAPAS